MPLTYKSRSINPTSEIEKDDHDWKITLEKTMVTFENMMGQVQNQKLLKSKMSNLIRNIFSNKSSAFVSSAGIKKKGSKKASIRTRSLDKIRGRQPQIKKSMSCPLIKEKARRMIVSSDNGCLLEEKINALIKEKAEILKKSKKEKIRLVENIMSEKIYADSLKDITERLEKKLKSREMRMKEILKQNNLDPELLNIQEEAYNSDEDEILTMESQKSGVTEDDENEQGFDFQGAFAMEVTGQKQVAKAKRKSKAKKEEDQAKEEKTVIDVVKEKEEIGKYKEHIDNNTSKINSLEKQNEQLASALKSIEEKIKNADKNTQRALKLEQEKKQEEMNEYKKRLDDLITLNLHMVSEVNKKREIMDEYSIEKRGELRLIRENLYHKYHNTKDLLELERIESNKMIARYQQELDMKNQKMMQMMGNFQKVKSISDDLKQYYETLKQHGFETGNLQESRS